jgi:hypothetical protein
MIRITPLETLFRQRLAFRENRLFAILDATAFDNLLIAIGKSGLEFESLFSGEDALVLSGEAPYIVALDGTKPKAVRDLFQAAKHPHAGFVIETDATIDDLRRHYASWLNVTIDEGTQMALFRFYDTRILLAFLGTLQATEAAAFWGPSERFYALNGIVPSVITRPTLSGPDRLAVPMEQPYAINAHQMEMVTQITDQVFRNRLADFLGRVFWEQGESLTLNARLAIVDQAIQDCVWLEVCGEGDVVRMAVIRLVKPDLAADESYRAAVVEQVPNPKQRSAAYLGEAAYGLSDEDRTAFLGKVNFWWEFVKGDI